jgi:hypothetical protein
LASDVGDRQRHHPTERASYLLPLMMQLAFGLSALQSGLTATALGSITKPARLSPLRL